jgi:hypothetical protein
MNESREDDRPHAIPLNVISLPIHSGYLFLSHDNRRLYSWRLVCRRVLISRCTIGAQSSDHLEIRILL